MTLARRCKRYWSKHFDRLKIHASSWARLDVNENTPLLDAARSGDDLPRLFELLKDKTGADEPAHAQLQTATAVF
jgi:hypothetical protein